MNAIKALGPTTPANLARINKMQDKLQTLMLNLYERWQDEKDYEDIKDYAEPIRKNLPEGFTLVKMTRKPFGFTFNIGTGVTYSIYVNGRAYGWKRI